MPRRVQLIIAAFTILAVGCICAYGISHAGPPDGLPPQTAKAKEIANGGRYFGYTQRPVGTPVTTARLVRVKTQMKARGLPPTFVDDLIGGVSITDIELSDRVRIGFGATRTPKQEQGRNQ